MRIIIFLSALIYTICGSSLCYASGTGTSVMNFLKIGVGARAAGMGEAYSALSNDVSAIYWNPAGLAQIARKEILLNHNKYMYDINYEFAGYACPLYFPNTNRSAGVFGFGIFYLGVKNIETYNASGMRNYVYQSVRDTVGVVSYAKDLIADSHGKKLAFGLGLKYLEEKLADEKASGYACDAGILTNMYLPRDMVFAFVVQNIGKRITFIEESAPLPKSLRIGVSYKLFKESLITACDISMPEAGCNYCNLGVEYNLCGSMAFRVGYKTRAAASGSDRSLDKGLRTGFGLTYNDISFDYAFVPYSDFDNTHRFSFGYKFGRIGDLDMINLRANEHYENALRYYNSNNLVNAQKELLKALLIQPSNKNAGELLSITYTKTDSRCLPLHVRYIKLLIKTGDLPKAKTELENILSVCPGNKPALRLIKGVNEELNKLKNQNTSLLLSEGVKYFDNHEYKDALRVWESILLFEPNNKIVQNNVGLAAKRLQEEEFKSSITKEFGNAVSSYEQGNYEFALNIFNELNSKCEDSSIQEAKNLKTECESYIKKCRTMIAETLYVEAVKRYGANNKNDALIKLSLSIKYDESNSKAAELYQKVLTELNEEKNKKMDKFYEEALAEYNSGNIAESRRKLDMILELDPGNKRAINMINRVRSMEAK